MNRSPYAVLALCSIAVFLASLDATVLFVAFQDIHRSYPQASPGGLRSVRGCDLIPFSDAVRLNQFAQGIRPSSEAKEWFDRLSSERSGASFMSWWQ